MQRKFASLWEMSQDRGIRQERPPAHEESILELASSGFSLLPGVATPSPQLGAAHPDVQEAETVPAIEGKHAVHSIPVAFAEGEEDSLPDTDEPVSSPQDALLDLRQQLNLHRADLYLGIAVLVALLALLWPTAAAPQRPHLGAWQRLLVNLGIAEAPAPQVRYRGNPNIGVWVDPHTALYYCRGEEQYGKTADGRLTRQREAQTDQFEPANRAACN